MLRYKFKAVVNHPDILLIDSVDIQYQIDGILETFQKKNIGPLVDNVPGVLTEPWEELEVDQHVHF